MRLWSDTDRARFFLIPEDSDLPPGSCFIKTITGRRQHVAPDALPAFEVSREQAEQWLRDQLGSAADALKTAVANVAARWKGKQENSEAEIERLFREAEQQMKDPAAANRQAAALDEIAQVLEQRSKQAAEHLRAASEDLRRRSKHTG